MSGGGWRISRTVRRVDAACTVWGLSGATCGAAVPPRVRACSYFLNCRRGARRARRRHGGGAAARLVGAPLQWKLPALEGGDRAWGGCRVRGTWLCGRAARRAGGRADVACEAVRGSGSTGSRVGSADRRRRVCGQRRVDGERRRGVAGCGCGLTSSGAAVRSGSTGAAGRRGIGGSTRRGGGACHPDQGELERTFFYRQSCHPVRAAALGRGGAWRAPCGGTSQT